MSLFTVICMYATWSSIFSLGKIALESAPPLFLTGFRMLFAGVLILLYFVFAKRNALKLTRRQFLSICLLAVFSIYLTNALEFWGLQYLSAGKTCFIYSLSPFFAALFSYLHFKEKMSPKKWIGISIGVLGILPMLMTQTGSEQAHKAFGFISWPALALIGAALASVYGWVLLRVIVKDQNLSPTLANGSSMFIGGLLALLHSFLSETWVPSPILENKGALFIKSMLLMTFISNIICYNIYGRLLRRFTATFLSLMGLLSPIFASLCAWALLGETPHWSLFVSLTIVSTGLWVVYQEELKQGYIVSKPKPAAT